MGPGHQLELGLRWLAATDETTEAMPAVASWRDFLARGETLAPTGRLRWARLWPLWGVISGVLTLSGLLVWPGGSGIHLLVFLLAFWAAPLLLVVITTVSGLLLGRTPWWRPLVTPHSDPVIALWFARQSLLAEALFCLAGLLWLWLLLVTREVIFFWSTSIAAVSRQVESLFHWLGAGIVEPPPAATIAAAEAGAISGWRADLLADSWLWALWLSQLLALWILLPAAVLALVCHWRLRRRLAVWPRFNHRLRLRYEALTTPAVSYQALQPEQPLTEPAGEHFPRLTALPEAPGFLWQVTDPGSFPRGSRPLGERGFNDDLALVENHGWELDHWYIGGEAVPTGDLADLLQAHLEAGGTPRLHVIITTRDEQRLAAQEHSWSVFLERNRLPLELWLVIDGEAANG